MRVGPIRYGTAAGAPPETADPHPGGLRPLDPPPLGGGWRPLGDSAATEIGRFTLKTKAQPPAELTGKYAVVWRRTGEGWKLDTDIWNADR